jgi:hypothetical protein
MLLPIVVGAVLAALFVLGVKAWAPRAERRVLALGLAVTALLYVVFALAGHADSSTLLLEAGGVALFGLVAWLGFRGALRWLAVGWAAHVAWDVGLHLDRVQTVVPMWYPLFCVGFDLMVAGFILGRTTHPSPTGSSDRKPDR